MECRYCNAKMWYQERTRKHRETSIPKFHLCCENGKVQLPLLKQPPPLLLHLLCDRKADDSKNYQRNIRLYNMMFSFTSAGAKFDNSVMNNKGPPTIRVQGQPCHRIGSLLPLNGKAPKYAQLYIYDPENEISNRIQSAG